VKPREAVNITLRYPTVVVMFMTIDVKDLVEAEVVDHNTTWVIKAQLFKCLSR
jgi:hypothetical protein